MKLRVISPIPLISTDSLDKDNFFKDGDYIPYRGNNAGSSNGYLKLLFDLFDLAPSQATCIGNIVRFGYKSISGFAQDYIAGLEFDGSKESLDDGLTKEIALALKETGASPLKILEVARCVSKYIKICGNAYVHYQATRVLDVVQIRLDVIHPRLAMLKKSDKFYAEVSIGNSYNSGNEKVLPIFPAFKESKKRKETVFHFKNIGLNNTFYGEPDTLATLRSQFIEYACIELAGKVSGKAEVASKIVGLPIPAGAGAGGKDDPKAQLRGMQRALKKLTNESDNPDTIGLIGKPFGETIQEFDLLINRDTDWYKAQMEIHSGIIYASHGDNKQLTGQAEAKAGLGGEVISALYAKYQEQVIESDQNQISDFMMQITDTIFEDIGKDNYIGSKIIFENSVDKLIKRLNGTSN